MECYLCRALVTERRSHPPRLCIVCELADWSIKGPRGMHASHSVILWRPWICCLFDVSGMWTARLAGHQQGDARGWIWTLSATGMHLQDGQLLPTLCPPLRKAARDWRMVGLKGLILSIKKKTYLDLIYGLVERALPVPALPSHFLLADYSGSPATIPLTP